jgi:hypothetical protein
MVFVAAAAGRTATATPAATAAAAMPTARTRLDVRISKLLALGGGDRLTNRVCGVTVMNI